LTAERGQTQSTGSPREDGISFLWTVLRADRGNIRFASMISGESVLFGREERRSMSKCRLSLIPNFWPIGKRAITADTDLRLTRYFGRTTGFFLRLQADYDLMARRRELGDDLELIEPRAA
jgi:hypothetical protein